MNELPAVHVMCFQAAVQKKYRRREICQYLRVRIEGQDCFVTSCTPASLEHAACGV